MKKNESKPAVKVICKNCIQCTVIHSADKRNMKVYGCPFRFSILLTNNKTCNQFNDKGKLRFQAKESITNEK